MEKPAVQPCASGTTFIQVDINSFRELVQQLTGISNEPRQIPATPGISKPAFKLQDRRPYHGKMKVEITKPGNRLALPRAGFLSGQALFSSQKKGFGSSQVIPSSVLSGYQGGTTVTSPSFPSVPPCPLISSSPTSGSPSPFYSTSFTTSSISNNNNNNNGNLKNKENEDSISMKMEMVIREGNKERGTNGEELSVENCENKKGELSMSENAISEKGFYLHPSPLSRDPELLTLFPLTSPKGQGS
ncbi:hypothetical protein AMTRI_Chr11g101940 [Amborella trichopoda]